MEIKKYPKIAYEHGLIAHAHIFKPCTKLKRSTGITLNTTVGEKEITVNMFEQLDISDEDLLLAIIALARPLHSVEDIYPPHEKIEEETIEGKLWIDLKIENSSNVNFAKQQTIAITTTQYKLLKYLELSLNTESYNRLIKSLDRLNMTRIKVKNGHEIYITHLLSYGQDKNKNLKIAINPLTAAMLLGIDKISYVTNNLDERYQLPKGIPRRLHAIFASCLNSKRKTQQINIVTLAYKIWDKDKITKKKIWKLRTYCMKLNQLEKWEIFIQGQSLDANIYWKIT